MRDTTGRFAGQVICGRVSLEGLISMSSCPVTKLLENHCWKICWPSRLALHVSTRSVTRLCRNCQESAVTRDTRQSSQLLGERVTLQVSGRVAGSVATYVDAPSDKALGVAILFPAGSNTWQVSQLLGKSSSLKVSASCSLSRAVLTESLGETQSGEIISKLVRAYLLCETSL